MNNGHWILAEGITLKDDELPYGFLYLITNTVNGRKYIGKKQMKSVKKLKPLKGKKNKRHFDVETDWRTYTSSSNDVNLDIEKFGKDKFTFEIIRLCGSKSEMAYEEIRLQIINDVLFRSDFYNGIVNCRLNRCCFSSGLIKSRTDVGTFVM